MHPDDAATIIIGVIVVSLILGWVWVVGGTGGEQTILTNALPPCNHATVGQEYGQYICMGKYSYVRRATK